MNDRKGRTQESQTFLLVTFFPSYVLTFPKNPGA
jgi:hypothetical protein